LEERGNEALQTVAIPLRNEKGQYNKGHVTVGKIEKKCPNCQKAFFVFPCNSHLKFCSKRCYYNYGPTEETRRRMSIAAKRRTDMIGENNPAKKPEIRRKISEACKGIKKPWLSEWNRTRKFSQDAIRRITEAGRKRVPWDKGIQRPEMSEAQKGEKNHSWKGGITPERESFNATMEWKNASKIVWRRDKRTCQLCHKKYEGVGRTFDVHHVIPFEVKESRADPNNLILLCRGCHLLVTSPNFVARFGGA
jgi:hypothetical protein